MALLSIMFCSLLAGMAILQARAFKTMCVAQRQVPLWCTRIAGYSPTLLTPNRNSCVHIFDHTATFRLGEIGVQQGPSATEETFRRESRGSRGGC